MYVYRSQCGACAYFNDYGNNIYSHKITCMSHLSCCTIMPYVIGCDMIVIAAFELLSIAGVVVSVQAKYTHNNFIRVHHFDTIRVL